MVPSVDFANSSLLCAEDDASIFEDSESYDCGEKNSGLSSLLPLVQGEDCLDIVFKREIQHLPCRDYLQRLVNGDVDLVARNEAVNWISKVNCYYNFGPLCGYLSINYMDRFLSAHKLPKGMDWTMQLLAIACISLAAKMDETEVPLSLDLQIEEAKYVFEAKTIQKMELLVLSTLKWRMQSVTPFSFLDYFLSKICFDQQITPSCLLARAIQIILNTAKGIEFLEYRPSEIAAAVTIYVTGQNYSTEETEKAFAILSDYVEKGRLAKCIEKIGDLVSVDAISGSAIDDTNSSVPQSPIGVLDASICLSYISDDATDSNSPDFSHPKRRKIDLENNW